MHYTAEGDENLTQRRSRCGTLYGASVKTFYFEIRGLHTIPSKYICISRVHSEAMPKYLFKLVTCLLMNTAVKFY